MNEKACHTLEFTKIKSRLEELAQTPGGKQLCRELTPMTGMAEIQNAQKETSDAEMRIIAKGGVSFSGVKDVRGSVMRLAVGSSLTISELLAVSSLLTVAARAKSYGRREDREEPDSLEGYFGAIEPLSPLNHEIKRCIISPEEISDEASPGLAKVRRSMKGIHNRIHDQLNALVVSHRNYLQDGVVTVRDGRYCIPVKAEYRAQVPGLVHDQSGSGSTFFVEPMPIVRLNNELRELELQEAKEIEAVLAALSEQVAENPEALTEDFRVLTHLDFVFAKAQLSRQYKGTEPLFNRERRIHIKQGRHPLLPARKVVPIDIWLGKDFDLLVITGPNTGGKTVTLKTLGLFTLMGQSGLHIPAASGSQLGIFHEVFADIGDEQSIEQNLSTFSAHMTNTVRILEAADEHSLVLFDELGAGTDPTEGAALAMAILQRLHRRGIRTVATTHYSELKVYALSTPGVENASCEFDVATLRPTYRLLIGVPGKSNAFAISRKLGLMEEVIEEAQASIGQQDEAFEDVISSLEAQRIQLEKDQKEAARLRDEAERLQQETARKQSRLDEQRDAVLRKAREEARDILQEAKNSADKAIRNLNKQGVRVTREMEAERSQLRDKMDENNKKLAGTQKKRVHKTSAPEDFRIGDAVHVISLNLDGTVSSLPNAKGNLTVQMGILRSQVNIRDLELLQEQTVSFDGKKTKSTASQIKMAKSAAVSGELNIIGKTVAEAIPELDKYLDDAYLAHMPSVRIIHGRGTGTLKAAVQSFLRKDKHRVASYRGGEFGEGSYGVTVVEFK
ncbi:MAG: endonuclease MutS2 [Lachnospiraceae bacterium]|nr:endonuclease MutS2 [Lachnospiraceae bacterium]